MFDKCHHDIIFGKIDICTPLPAVYICAVWDHSEANEENIRNTINWSKAFKNLPVDGKVEHLNETYLFKSQSN